MLVAAGVNAVVAQGQGDIADQLLVDLEPDSDGRALQMRLMFMAGMEPAILQLYAGLPFVLASEVGDSLCHFLAAANVVLPVGNFGFAEATGLLYYRYNVATAAAEFDFDGLLWSMASAAYMIERVAPLIERVASGGSWTDAADDLASTVAADTLAAEGDGES